MMTQKQHIFEVTDTYVGSDEKVPRVTRILQVEPLSLRDKEIRLPVAIERLFVEILSNASDNVDKSRKAKVDPGDIVVHVDAHDVMIRNGGLAIPVEKHSEYGIYTPELIFGHLLTSSNYRKDVDRTGCGRNGYGAKLVNIFSVLFAVEVGDSSRKLKYSQYWEDHMDIKHEPEVVPYQGPSYVQISYRLDFARFNYNCYPDEAMALFGRHAADTALSMGVTVHYNQLRFSFAKISNYAKLLVDDKVNHLTHRQPGLDLCLLDTVSHPIVISSINGMMTPDGGVHVEAVYKAIAEQILPVINKEKPGVKTPKLTLGDIKAHLSIILVCHLPNPKFNSQIKTKLTSPTPKLTIDPNQIKKMYRWRLFDHLYAMLEAKQTRALSKTDGKKSQYVDIDKAEDANLAGTKQSQECTLFVVEGKSAKGYANCLQALIPRGRDLMGIYPMKGKPLNVMNASYQQIADNQELKELKEILGLREGVDYTNDKNFKTLRYGYFVILTDADDDGKHIAGLILNIFYCRYPSLLQRGYVMFLRTPILRVWKGQHKLKFYSQASYLQWREQTPNYRQWDHKYYKGLATSKKEEVEDDFQDPKTVMCLFDEDASDALDLAFHRKLANRRKQWIEQYREVLGIEDMEQLPISTFINYEFIKYSIGDLARSIPRLVDGLKTSQRKAIWSALVKWKRKNVSNKDEFKVARFANYVAEQTSYHHGENCMADTIVSMAQDFVGANNLPFFAKDGQFGTRNDGGKDAGNPRYIFTKPNWWLPLVFHEEDDALLERVMDEGEAQEPIAFYPVIPLVLVNGMNGIGTGYSTFIPNYNPLDLIQWIRNRLSGKEAGFSVGIGETNSNPEAQQLVPWYRGFTGDISLKYHGARMVPRDEDDPLGPDELVQVTDRCSVVISGKFTTTQTQVKGAVYNKILVTELPIGRSMHDYKNWLDTLRKEKKIVSYTNNSTDDKPNFTIIGFDNPTLKTLRLVRTFGLSNMVLLDEHDKPHRYGSAEEIIEAYAERRLDKYQERKETILGKLNDRIKAETNKAELISAVVSGTLKVFNRALTAIHQDMDQLGLDKSLLKGLSLTSCTEDKITKLHRLIEELQTEAQRISSLTPADLWLTDLDKFEHEYRKRCR